jgi:hypothetical protein
MRAYLTVDKLGFLICRLRAVSLISLLVFSSGLALADAGVFTGNGQNLRQITSKEIRLKSIEVNVVLGRGPFLYDGTVPGMDEVRYDCTFVLQNLTNSTEDVQVGFPVDSEFARRRERDETAESKQNWVLNYGFIALDEKTTYRVEFVRRNPKSPDEFRTVFVWKMNFGPHEVRKLRVIYHMPMTTGLVSTEREDWNTRSVPPEALSAELVTVADMEVAGYITSTGSSWSGNVENAVFSVYLDGFEHYLDRRGMTERDVTSMPTEEAEQYKESFPVSRPWWFRDVSPSGWKPVEGGIQWQYENYKPQDPITVAYYITQIPKTAFEVHPFVEHYLKSVRQKDSVQAGLSQLREFILATFGKEPDDPTVRSFAAAQKWYSPQKDFSLAKLSSEQRGVLDALDQEISKRKGN